MFQFVAALQVVRTAGLHARSFLKEVASNWAPACDGRFALSISPAQGRVGSTCVLLPVVAA